MRTELFLALFLLPLRPLIAAGAGEGVPWGSETDGQYRAWDWISAFTEEDQNTWDGLAADGQEAVLKRAGDACLAADRASLAAQTRGDAGALSALPDETLDQLSVCVENGKARAGVLREKRDRLNQIILRSKNRPLSQTDLNWLEANSIRLQDPSLNDAAASGEIERQNKTAQKRNRNAEKKFSKLKDGKSLTSAGLASIYDGSGSKGKDSPQYPDTVALKDEKNAKLSLPGPETRGPRKKLTSSAPPELALTEEFKGQKGYAEINKENKFTGVMDEVDKDGASGGTANAAKAAALKTVFQISKDFDETFINNPSPKDADVRLVIDKIKNKAKNPDDAWELAAQMRNTRDFPALRDAEHYLWSCARTTGSKWNGAATLISTPLYSIAKLPGLRKIFFDDATSPPSGSEIKWGAKGVRDCW